MRFVANSGYIDIRKSLTSVSDDFISPNLIFVVNGVIGRTDSVFMALRVANVLSSDDVRRAFVVISVLPSLSVACASNVNNFSDSNGIFAVAVAFAISIPPVAFIDTNALADAPLSRVMFVITEFILNESFGATNVGADVDIINGD